MLVVLHGKWRQLWTCTVMSELHPSLAQFPVVAYHQHLCGLCQKLGRALVDCTEWTPGKSQIKYTILVCMDLVTKFKATRILLECGLIPNSRQSQRGIFFSTLASRQAEASQSDPWQVCDFIKDARSAVGDEHHAWSSSSQGIVGSWTFTACDSGGERCCRQDCPGQPWPFTSNLLDPCHQCPQLQGYTPFQWVYGSQPRLDDEDSAAFPIEPTEAIDFTALLQRRQAAEEIARKVKLIAPSTSCATPRCVDLFRPLLPWN